MCSSDLIQSPGEPQLRAKNALLDLRIRNSIKGIVLVAQFNEVLPERSGFQVQSFVTIHGCNPLGFFYLTDIPQESTMRPGPLCIHKIIFRKKSFNTFNVHALPTTAIKL